MVACPRRRGPDVAGGNPSLSIRGRAQLDHPHRANRNGGACRRRHDTVRVENRASFIRTLK